MRSPRVLVLLTAALLAACADGSTAPTRPLANVPSLQQSAGRGVLQRYVAIGTSISMGWTSDGVYANSQVDSWPAQLARMGEREITQPYIQFPGCRSPIAPPLALGVRLSGELILANPATLSCAPLVEGVVLPTQNLAINGARTTDALFTTPENVTDPANRAQYARVLPPGATQVSAMAAQDPKLVSVELGANEVLGARSGVALVGPPPATILAPQLWAPSYRQLLDRVEATTAKHVLLVGLFSDPASMPAFRFGAEIWANAAIFLAGFNVAVQADCGSTNSQNLVFTPSVVLPALQAGAAAKAVGQGPVPLTCAGGSPTTVDFVLTPSEQATVATVVAQMNAIIRSEAQMRGFAYFDLDALFATPGVRTPFNMATLMTSPQPFGPYMGLDGVHPNAAGQALLANAAARALNERYALGIPVGPF